MLIVRKFAYGFVAFTAMYASTAFAAALPAGYKQCLCIYVTNENQYIDTTETGYLPKLATDVEAHFEVPDFSKQNPLYWTRNNKDNQSEVGPCVPAVHRSERQ